MNQLKKAHSPYLLQHAENPVYWNFWNDETLQRAKSENKLLLISIGYSACHWCHVMEHECFEDLEVADVMNSSYISIKIDREEQPEVDAIYMKALQLMTKQGGWPLNIVALPNGKPVWGATYVNKENWMDVLSQLATLYESDPEKMIDYADKLLNGIEIMSDTDELPKAEKPFNLGEIVQKWQKSFDLDFGGYARAPKFMMPSNLDFLQTYGFINNNKEILNHVDLTLTRMAWGGLFDTVHGGFSRYSVDMKWHIPHFEKMLYDNALLLKVYADAYKRTKNTSYLEVIKKTISFLKDELMCENGGFYSALDADSLDHKNQLTEGAFYVWKIEELKSLIQEDYDLFEQVFNINSYGFWEDDNYVLIQNDNLENIANKHHISSEELSTKKRSWEIILKNHRNKRSKPRLDDKIITSWNAMLLSAFSHANSILNNDELSNIILKLEKFISNQLTNENFELGHTFKNNELYIDGLFEDYAFIIQAYIDLYTNTLNEAFINQAKNYTNVAFDLFFDSEKKFFRSHKLNKNLITNHFDIEDNVIPASNSIMANNLIFLGMIFDNKHYVNVSENMLSKITESIDYASAFSHWLLAFLKTEDNFKEISIIGAETEKFHTELIQDYLPNSLICGSSKPSDLQILKNYSFKNTKNTEIYVCSNKKCLKPFTKFSDFINYYQNINNQKF